MTDHTTTLVSRRRFLAGAAAGTVASATAARVLAPTWAFATPADPTRGDVIVAITLRGGLDGLSLSPPHGDPAYRALRPTIAIPSPGAPGGAIDLDGTWGLHPAMAPLWNRAGLDGRLAVVRGVGIPDSMSRTRSHFEASEYWDRGRRTTTGTGWATRHLRGGSGLPARSFGSSTHPVFAGHQRVMSGRGLTLSFRSFDARGEVLSALSTAYGGSSPIDVAGRAAVGAASVLNSVDWDAYGPATDPGYPGTGLGRDLGDTARMIRAGIGLQAVALAQGGYDTHVGQGDGTGGNLAARLDDLARSLAAFWDDLGPAAREEVTIVVMSEFGRTLLENGDAGTDHGRATTMLVLGGTTNGGLHGVSASLDPDVDRNAWPVTTDYRTVLAEILTRRRAEGDLATVFPGYAAQSFLGLVA